MEIAMELIGQFLPILIKVLSKEENMNFIFGLILGVVIGGAGAFIYLAVTKQLALKK
jgi:hypothetical protein